MKVLEGPRQVMAPVVLKGVTVMMAESGELPLLSAMNDGILPFPKAGKPIAGLLFVQLNIVVPLILVVVKMTADVAELGQTDWLAG